MRPGVPAGQPKAHARTLRRNPRPTMSGTMGRMPRTYHSPRFTRLLLAEAGLGFTLWTLIVLGTRWLAPIDGSTLARVVANDSFVEQVAEAFALATHPLVLVAVLLVVSWWALRRRLRNLSLALQLAAVFGWLGSAAVRWTLRRERPPSPFDHLLTHHGYAYPSGHLSMITCSAILVVAVTTTTRQSRGTILGWRALGIVAVVLVGLDRWLLNAHWLTDIIGGVLFGALAAGAALVIARVDMQPVWYLARPRRSRQRPTSTHPRAAVIYNPIKVLDEATFRRHVRYAMTERGWQEPLWLTTERDDPGFAMTRQALSHNVDLVIGAGGDGTVRAITSELAHTGVSFGLVPAGTGNVLARNLGIPLDENDALTIALDGTPTQIDLVRATVDDEHDQATHFAVMAGIGIDGQIMQATNAQLKKVVRTGAYAVAVAQNLTWAPVPATVTLDGEVFTKRPASLMLVGNVGEVMGRVQLFPQASATDGQFDLIVTGPRGVVGWARWGVQLLAKQAMKNSQTRGHSVRVELERPLPYQLDGDTEGEARIFEAEVVPGALTINLPR